MARGIGRPRITGVKGKGLTGLIARVGVAKYLEELDDRSQDFTPTWGGIIAEFQREQQDVFVKEGAVGGHPAYEPLTHEYALWKARPTGGNKPGVPILYLAARGPQQSLSNALTDPTGSGLITKWGKWHLLIQTNVPVGKSGEWDLGGIHMVGRGAPNPMAAREPIRLTMAEVWRMVGHALNWLLQGKSSTRAVYS